MNTNHRKTNSKKKYIVTILFCTLTIFTVVLILFKKNRKEGNVVAIYVQEQGSDYVFTSRDDGLSWADGNTPAFFMTTQEDEIRQNKENIIVTIQNKSYDVMIYGEAFYLYRWSKNAWIPYEMKESSEYDLTFNQRAHLLLPDTRCDLECNLQYYDLKCGKYLLKKNIMIEETDSDWDLSVEFVVN